MSESTASETGGNTAAEHEQAMGLALEQARLAEAHGDVPIGAAILRDGEPLALAGNERELRRDPTAHAEILAIRAAAEALGGWRLPGTTLYVTLEPCAMCAGAIVLARIPTVVLGAPDPKAGAAGSILDILAEPALNHRPAVITGIREEECATLLRDFFQQRRSEIDRGGEKRVLASTWAGMPTISRFFGITIAMFFNDHGFPHFHARHAEGEAKVRIDNLEIMDNNLSVRQLRFVLAWAELHQAELERNWRRARAGETLSEIEPLR